MEGSLLCWEAERELRAQADSVLLQSRVLDRLLTSQDTYTASPMYFQCVQKEIYPYMRKMLTSWMLEVCEDQQCGEEVFPQAVNCLDRFLSVLPVEKRRLQLVGATCLLLASKLKESKSITIENLCMYSDFSFTATEMRAMELLILNKLKWDIEAVTPRDFLPHFLQLLSLSRDKMQQVRKHAETFIALCTTDCTFIGLPASMVAAASVAAAVTGLRPENLGMTCSSMAATNYLAKAIRCDSNILRMCQEQIELSLESNLRQATSDRPTDSKAVAVEELERASTPTDVLDFDL
ncbi:hypothetical protein GDO81_020411 [Engystomops pustulosus]|uniref:Cyclin D1 n=1 Tax=Engystomops pustulosus TaxID=76066 RepID=A0AAV6ZHR5_ENGPU|nr:hypothetical protein GDO81_020411 [Engystomops pustulosus]